MTNHRRTARPVILGVVGDSAAGKTTLTRGLVRVLGEDNVTHVCTDDYHRYDRRQRAERNITPLHPDCNYMDIMAQHLGAPAAGRGDPQARLPAQGRHVRAARLRRPGAVLGRRGPARLLTAEMRDVYDVRVFLTPPEELRRKWKVQRDCSRRGYTTDQVLAELDRREPDSEAFIRPQRRYADIVVSFLPTEADRSEDQTTSTPSSSCATLPHPDLSPLIDGEPDGLTVIERGGERVLRIPGRSIPTMPRRSRRRSGTACTSPRHLRTDGSASSRSAPTCTAPSRWRWSSC